jgi:uracil-DNA glycosylase
MSKDIKQVTIEASWAKALAGEFTKPYFAMLKEFLIEERLRFNIFPPGPKIFAAFDATPIYKVKVVIVGQDPYHGPGQANGLCFSVSDGVRLPPSLVNIFKEIESDTGLPLSGSGDLMPWARQGVLLLNTTLTVRSGVAASHQGKGWEHFTDEVIRTVSSNNAGVVFLLWGKPAQGKEKLIDTSKHYVLKAPHPSPLSAYTGFWGCRHFTKANKILIDQGKQPIHWPL